MDARDKLIFNIGFVLSKRMPKRQRQTPPEREAEVRDVAVKVVEHLERSRYTFGRLPPARSHSWPPLGSAGES